MKLTRARYIPNPACLEQASFSASAAQGQGKSLYDLLLRSEVLGAPASNQLFYHAEQPENISPYALSPISKQAEDLLSTPRAPPRRISKVPYKVLEAPMIQDDFYLNLVDWSSSNLLAVALGSSVYAWNAVTSVATKLCDVRGETNDSVTSVGWANKGSTLAVGTQHGNIHVWDVGKQVLVHTIKDHKVRVGALAWSGPTLASGCRDRNITLSDVRQRRAAQTLGGHRQEVCGLKWAPEGTHLASGGNDNRLLVWDVRATRAPQLRFNEHVAAVKALAWSPHQRGLLASGGGTADRTIKTWSTISAACVSSTDTGSQVCNIAWSRNADELVSTHGYSQNQIVVWNHPTMSQIATLTGHTMRVLYLAVSPDGQTIVTGAGDETLRFWNVFQPPRKPAATPHSSVAAAFQIR
jgi:cell division cycle 20-like protein 1 (cofactor of APC complex)